MRVLNHTRWDTAHLRAIFQKCLAEIKRHERGRWELQRFRVSVDWHRRGAWWVGGHAAYHSHGCTILMPSLGHDSATERRVADVFIHEVGHCLGVKHTRKTRSTIEHSYQAWLDANFTSTLVRSEPVKVEPKVDMRLVRFERAKANLAAAQRRYKHANTLLRKWLQRTRYYERTLAPAMAKPKP